MKKSPKLIDSLALIFPSWEKWGLKKDVNDDSAATLNFAGLCVKVLFENNLLTVEIWKNNSCLETQEIPTSDIYEAARKVRFIAAAAYRKYAGQAK